MCETNSKHIELQLGLQYAVFKTGNLLSHYQKHDIQSDCEKVTCRPTQYNDVGCIGVFCYSYGQLQFVHRSARSEERRVGKECRSRWSPYH